MPRLRVVVQCGDLGLSHAGVSQILAFLLGHAGASLVVTSFDAKVDDTEHDFLWYYRRICRFPLYGRARRVGRTTLYLGQRTGEQVKVYDKVAEASGKGERPWSQLETCTRIEKTVRIPAASQLTWEEFIHAPADTYAPFRAVLVGDTDGARLGLLETRVKEMGLHNALRWSGKEFGRRRTAALKRALFDSPALNLQAEWARRLESWVCNPRGRRSKQRTHND